LLLRPLEWLTGKEKPQPGLIFHSDRGSQYASNNFKQYLKKYGFQSSMRDKGNCFDKAVAETFFHSLKVELVHDEKFHTRIAAKSEIFNYIEIFYNRNRLHSTLNYCTPFDQDQTSCLGECVDVNLS
jgi:putative transposase